MSFCQFCQTTTENPCISHHQFTVCSNINRFFQQPNYINAPYIHVPTVPVQENRKQERRDGDRRDALSVQIGGDHYKNMAIQPIEYIRANNLGFEAGNVLKYITRYKTKNGVDDLKKARHYLDLLIEWEEQMAAVKSGTGQI